MDEIGQPDQSALRARLEFPIWHRSFARSYAAWSSAPSDLKAPLLLSGPALAKAEGWLLACPERLSDSEKRFIVRSISQRTKSDPGQVGGGRSRSSIRLGWKRPTDRSLWQLYAVIAVGLWVFAPDFIKETMESALNAPEVIEAGKNGPMVIATPNAKIEPDLDADGPVYTNMGEAKDTSREARSARAPQPPAVDIVEEAVEPEPPAIVEPPPAAAPPPPPPSRVARLAELALEQQTAGRHREGFLVAIEAAELALMEEEAGSQVALKAAAVLNRAMSTRTELAVLSPRHLPAETALLCDDARGVLGITRQGGLVAWSGPDASRSKPLGAWHGILNGVSVDRGCRVYATGNEDYDVEIRPLAGGAPLAVLNGHEAAILSIQFSPDGKILATASEDNTARLWDARSGRARAILSGHDWQVTSIAFSPDGRRVLTASTDRTARIWDVATGRQIHVLGEHMGIVTSASFSADGRLVLTTSWDGAARIWDAATGGLVRTFQRATGNIVMGWLSPDGRVFAALSDEADGELWSIEAGGKPVALSSGGGKVHSVTFAPSGQLLAVLRWDGKVVLHDAATGAAVSTLTGEGDRVRAFGFVGGGTTAVAVTEAGSRLTWPLAASLADAVVQARSMAPRCFSADERTMLGLESGIPAWCREQTSKGAVLPR